jgi:MFS family permease
MVKISHFVFAASASPYTLASGSKLKSLPLSYITSYGSFQTHYEQTLLDGATGLPVPPSTIAWVGSVQIFLAFFIGFFSGRALDGGARSFRTVHIAGLLLHALGAFATAECTTVWWQVFCAQALCSGVAHGLMYPPAMALVTTYFARRRAIAVGIAALGSCTGGVVFPVLMRELLPRIGFAWTVRSIGFVVVGCDLAAAALFRVRLKPRRRAPWVDWQAFRELPYGLFCAAMFCNFWVRVLCLEMVQRLRGLTDDRACSSPSSMSAATPGTSYTSATKTRSISS